MTAQQLAAIDAAVLALPPMTHDQVKDVCGVILAARERWARADRTRDSERHRAPPPA